MRALEEPPDDCGDPHISLVENYSGCATQRRAFGENWSMPLSLFKLFMTEDVLDTVVINTNAYAINEGAMERRSSGRARPWKAVTTAKLKIWLGLVIHMSVVHATLSEYWSRCIEPSHDRCLYVSHAIRAD